LNELVTLRKDEAVTTSLLIAEMFHKSHAHVLRDIENLDCSPEFTKSNFGLSKYKDVTGKYNPMYYITKDGFTFLVMGYRGKKAAEFKEAYIGAFNKMESILREKSTSVWLEARQKGMITRKAETDVIKELVEYAKAQGSTHADMLYMTYSRLANALCGIKSRDQATSSQLHDLSIFENLILSMIRNGIEANMDYKQIYKECKDRCYAAQKIAMIGA
jgi:Rha family phage regulatory protein